MLWSKRRSSRQEPHNSIIHKAQPEQLPLPSHRQSIPPNSSPRLPLSPLDPLDPQGSQSSLTTAADLSSSGGSSSFDQTSTLAKQAIGRQTASRESFAIKSKMSSESTQTTPEQDRRSPKANSQPSTVTPSVEAPGALPADLYTYNSLNSFSFGSVQPQSPVSLSRPVHPLSTGHGDADSVNEDSFLGPDVTPRPSVIAYDHVDQFRSHPAQPPGQIGGSPSKRTYPQNLPEPNMGWDPTRSGRESDTASQRGSSSASASVTSLSTTSADFSRAGSRASHHTISTSQTSADHSSIDEDDHHHPIPPRVASAIARGTRPNVGIESNTAMEFSSDEEYVDSEYDDDYYDEDTGINIEIGSAQYEGSVVTHDWDLYSGAGGSNGSVRGQASFGYSDRRGSIPMAIPGTTPAPNPVETSVFSTGRNREDSLATLRRPSRSLDDDFNQPSLGRAVGSSILGESTLQRPLQPSPTSVPGSDGDWRILEERNKSRGKAREMDTVLAPLISPSGASVANCHSPANAPAAAMDAFDPDWAQMRGGITALDPNELGDIIGNPISAPSCNERRPSTIGARWLTWVSKDARRPSTATVSSYGGDSFGKAIRSWDGPRYQAQRRDWSFKKEKVERPPDSSGVVLRRTSTTGFLSPRGSMTTERAGVNPAIPGEQERDTVNDAEKDKGASSAVWKGMRIDSTELWRNDLVGRFKVDRRAAKPTDESKGPQQRLVVQRVREQTDTPAPGPLVTVHKHSKATAFSISRHYRPPRKRVDVPPTSSRATDATLNTATGGGSVVPATKKSSSMILLAPLRVQEAYTSTNTTRKLESHGLLDDGAAGTSTEVKDKERLARHKERDLKRKQKERERPKTAEEVKGKGKGKQQSKDDGHIPIGFSPVAQSLPPPPASAPSSHTYPPGPSASSSSLAGREVNVADRAISRTSSHHSRRRRRVRDPLEDDGDDDDENDPPTRTPHSEAFGTMDAVLIEQLRQDRHNGDADKGLWSRFLGRGGNASAASSAQIHAPFVAPWLALQPRNKQESHQGVINTLNDSFKDVGLLPSNYSTSRHAPLASQRQKKIASGNGDRDPFRGIPEDSLYMLLPLWPGDTDPRSGIAAVSFERPVIPNDKRQYILVYYKVPDTPNEEPSKSREGSKRSRTSPTSSYESGGKRDDRVSILLSSFHITARLVPYKDLQGTGVRIPDEGLAVTGPLNAAFEQMPPLAADPSMYEWVVGMCHSRDAGIEFYPDGLLKLGLCLQTSPMIVRPTSEEEEVPEPDMKLTPIGRAVLEMVWLGALALTSFGSVA